MPIPKSRPSVRPAVLPYWQTTDRRSAVLYLGDALAVLRALPPRSVHCAVTSPPYWSQRDYGTAGRGGLGLEATFTEYVDKLVAVFRELRRVLRDDGTFWLNIGDTYTGGAGLAPGNLAGLPWRVALAMQDDGWVLRQDVIWAKPDTMPQSVSNRCTTAHEYVFLFSKGPRYFYDWYATREKAVSAPHAPGNRNIAPEKNDRGHLEDRVWGDGNRNKRSIWTIAHGAGYGGNHFAAYPPALVEPCILAGTSAAGCCPTCAAPWRRVVAKTRVPTRPGEDSKAWRAAKPVGRLNAVPGPKRQNAMFRSEEARVKRDGMEAGNRDPLRHVTETRSLGWYPSCKCLGLPPLPKAPHSKDPAYEGWALAARELCGLARAEVDDGDGGYQLDPAVVLDPFVGSGTTALVALALGRHFTGIDLSEDYLANHVVPRVSADLGGRPALRHLLPTR